LSLKLIAAKTVFGGYLILRLLFYYFRSYWILSSILFLLFLAAGLKIIFFPNYDRTQLKFENSINVLVPKGASLREVANILETNGILKHKKTFIYLGRISGYQNKIHAGLFSIPQNLPPWHLLKYLIQPQMADVKVTLPEGLECPEIAGILRSYLNIDSSRFMSLVNDSMICREFGIEAGNLEGYLLPETYFFMYQMDVKEILKILVSGTLTIFEEDTVQFQMAQLRMSRHQLITMASIIEGEVVVDSERVLVSSVYHNRLRRGWLLGADPTIQYVIPGPPRRLLQDDLEIVSPYNTYKYRGLPPGPINNPGKKSILAAIFPADTNYMYFVATGNGGHHFSSSAAEHAHWKANFDQIRKQVKRNQRNNKGN
jgi:UPF0755 protein